MGLEKGGHKMCVKKKSNHGSVGSTSSCMCLIIISDDFSSFYCLVSRQNKIARGLQNDFQSKNLLFHVTAQRGYFPL
jgi:hypothetical protein